MSGGAGEDSSESLEAWVQNEIGTTAEWLSRTLEQTLDMYYRVYDVYVLPFDIKQAEADTDAANASPSDKAYFRQIVKLRKLERDKRYSFLYNQYGDRMTAIVTQLEERLRAEGVEEDGIVGIDEFFNDFFQHPSDNELFMTLQSICDYIATEYTTGESVLA